ncbi:glucosaminidase domain-containing protein [Chrysiogenes arsenatis]|uniref:glucosaminidase domain-containing protein n=1 Tax=Chrysiogenes arsenatis TaxID=309797 RepID=UPI00041FB743|nr:glucosaminidase domain-containing protein [Chrysiogenes arsenatis]
MGRESRFEWIGVATISAALIAVLCWVVFTSPVGKTLATGESNDDMLAGTVAPPALRVVPDADEYLAMIDLESGVVPPLTMESLPPNLELLPVPQKKEAFIKLLLPPILRANEQYALLREQIQHGIFDDSLYEEFKLNPDDGVEKLLRRVDTIPVSLVLAQAAIESAWGTSRFAMEGNNIFGHWTYLVGQGMVPAGREGGKSHELRIFESLEDSVQAYFYNLNTNRAYKEFREAREVTRNPLELAQHLRRYSELGEEYVEMVQRIIDYNNFQGYDPLRLLAGAQHEWE